MERYMHEKGLYWKNTFKKKFKFDKWSWKKGVAIKDIWLNKIKQYRYNKKSY